MRPFVVVDAINAGYEQRTTYNAQQQAQEAGWLDACVCQTRSQTRNPWPHARRHHQRTNTNTTVVARQTSASNTAHTSCPLLPDNKQTNVGSLRQQTNDGEESALHRLVQAGITARVLSCRVGTCIN